MNHLSYAVIDTETTGLASTDCAVSIAAVLITNGIITDKKYWLVNPQKPIPPEVTAIHHLTDQDVASAPIYSHVLPELIAFTQHCDAYIAHNAPFDCRMLPDLPSKPWVDTLVLTRTIHPSLDSYRNDDLRTILKLDCAHIEGSAHNALYDAQVTAQLFLHLLPLLPSEINTLPRLISFQQEESHKPRLLPFCFFPKYRNQRWETIPDGYLFWLLKNVQQNPNVMFTARHHLQLRGQI